MKKTLTSGLAIAALTGAAILTTAMPAQALTNPSPVETPVAFTVYVDEAYSGRVAATLTGGTWDWSFGNYYRFSDNVVECATGFADLVPAGLVFVDQFDGRTGVWPNYFDVSGTPTAADAVGGPASDGVYPVCVDIFDDEAGHSFLAMTITVLERPVTPPVVVDPTLASTGVDGTLVLGLGLGAAVLAGLGAVTIRASRRRTASN